MSQHRLTVEQKAIVIRLLIDLRGGGELQRSNGLDPTAFCPPCKSFADAEWNLRSLARRGLVLHKVPGPHEPQHEGGWALNPKCDPALLADVLSEAPVSEPSPLAPRSGGMRHLPLTDLQQKMMDWLWCDHEHSDYEYDERGSDISSFCPPCRSEDEAKAELEKLRAWDLVVWVEPLATDAEHHGGWKLNESNDATDIAQAIADGDYTVGRAPREPTISVAARQAMIDRVVSETIARVKHKPAGSRKPARSGGEFYAPGPTRDERRGLQVLAIAILVGLALFAWLYISRTPRGVLPPGVSPLPGTGPATRDMFGNPIQPKPEPTP